MIVLFFFKVKSEESLKDNKINDERRGWQNADDSANRQLETNEEFQCHICLHSFPSHDIFEKHVKLHNLAKSRFYKCKLCEFSSSNLEMYCRHICSLNTNKYVSCTQCKRSFLASQTQNEENGNVVCKQCLERRVIKNTAPSQGVVLLGSDVTIKRNPSAAKPEESLSSTNNYKILQSKEGPISKPPHVASVKPKLVRKLTTEGSIEYEEQHDVPPETLSGQEMGMTARTGKLHAVEGEIYSSDDNTADITFNQPETSGNVVYLYDDKTPEIKVEKTVKIETEDENVSEVLVPDHLLEQISNKTGRTTPYMLKCSNCEEVLDVRQLPSHRCFLELEAVEFFEVENALEIDMGLTKKETLTDDCQYGYIDQDGYYQTDEHIVGVTENEETSAPYQPRLLCKTCFLQFPSITQLREHWQDSGHAWEVGTVNVDVKTIKDKVKDNEQTFKVVKQMFSMKANLPVQNVVESNYTDEHMFNIKNLFVKVRANNECETCGKLFASEELMKDHIEECLSCTHCEIRFLSNNLLKKHYMCTGHWRKIVRDQDPSTRPPLHQTPANCHLCGKECFSRYSLVVHLKTHYAGTSKGFCHYCLKEFDDKSKILDHVIEVHNAHVYKCQHCDQAFLSEAKREKHEVIKHKDVECRLCNRKFRSLKMLLNHNDQVHREKACRVCGKYIDSWQSLKRHEKRHFYEKGLQCGLCHKSFRNKTALKVHNATHHKGDFKYYCSICDSGFVSAEACAEHKVLHLKSKNVCPKCGKKCRSRTAFWMHKKMHDGPYSCTVCSRIFRDTSLLAIHRRKHLRARRYQCPHCPRMFSVPRTLKRHLKVHTVAYPFRCTVCRRGFISKHSYSKHLSKVHNLKQREQRAALPLDPTDEDIILAADNLISDDAVMLNGYQRGGESTITEVVVETTELFDEILS